MPIVPAKLATLPVYVPSSWPPRKIISERERDIDRRPFIPPGRRAERRKLPRRKETERKSRPRTNPAWNEPGSARKREISGRESTLPFHRHPDGPPSPVPRLPGRTTLTFFPVNRDSIGTAGQKHSPDTMRSLTVPLRRVSEGTPLAPCYSSR